MTSPEEPAPPARDTPPAEHRLTDAEACDLDLLLAGVLPSGVRLGGAPVSPDGPASSGTGTPAARLSVPVEAARSMLEAGSVVLRDDENTPVAVLAGLTLEPADDGVTVHGTATRGRQRASGTLAELSLGLPDPALHGRDVLALARPPVEADQDDLRSWAGSAGRRPLLVVPEGGSGRQVPAVTMLRLAQVVAARLQLVDPEFRVAPLFLRKADDDRARARRLLDVLDARHTLLLSEDGGTRADLSWARAREDLDLGTSTGPLPGVDAEVEAVLRRWRPRRHERGLVVLMTGLSGSGKSTLARDLTTHLHLRSSREVTLLDGDALRRLLSAGLGFDRRSRDLNVLRIGWVAARLAELGGTAVCSPIAPFAETRAAVRAMVEPVADLVLVHVSTPLAECERRDLKGLYARARRGEIPDFTGISSPYEVPDDADVRVDTTDLSRTQALAVLVDHLVRGGWLQTDASPR